MADLDARLFDDVPEVGEQPLAAPPAAAVSAAGD